jgi:hypothetical protein
MSINHKQLFFKLVLKNWYFVPIPVFNAKKKKTGIPVFRIPGSQCCKPPSASLCAKHFKTE